MKTVKLICMAMLSMAMVMISCSGEDGATGPAGPAGADGVDGTDGTDGVDGVDGNANVNDYDFLVTDFSGTNFTVNLMDGSGFEGDLGSYAFLYYLKISDADGTWIQAPGSIQGLAYTTVTTEEETGDITVVFYNQQDNSLYEIDQGVFSLFRVVAIEFSTQASKDAQENVIGELKAAGVDTSDYYAVAEYFGLE